MDWTAPIADEEDDGGGYDEEGDERGFDMEANELEREIFSMRGAIAGVDDGDESEEGVAGQDGNEESQVDQLEAMMLRMQAVRGMYDICPGFLELLYKNENEKR